VKLELRLDKRRHMHRLDLGKIQDADLRTEAGKLPHSLHVGGQTERYPFLTIVLSW
jgi:hypothetical protein